MIIVGFALMLWIIRLSWRLRDDYRPPFGLAGPFEFLRLDYYTANGRRSIAKIACALALISFVFVALGLLSTLSPPTKPIRPGGPAPPPDFFFVAASAMCFAGAQLAGAVLLLVAALQFGWAAFRSSSRALRTNAARYAVYGVGAFVVAAGHFTLLKLGPGLLK